MLSRRTLLISALTAAALPALPAFAKTPDVFAPGGVAINGYDPVAYFTQGEPVEGDPSLALDWTGAVWHFASAENRATFEANPKAYAPQYGGYCAYAVANGYTAETDPDAWAVVDNKLYLNFNRRIQRRWERDIPGYIASADANWPQVLAE